MKVISSKYKKKPLIIEAIQYGGCVLDIVEKFIDIQIHQKDVDCCYITTLEGIMRCDINDYIIKGIKGEFYPIREDIFLESYEKVNNE